MTIKYKHIRSNVAGKIPTPADMEVGEIAVNFADKKVFTKEPGGTVVELGSSSGGGVNYASDAEVLAGTVTNKVISPEGLHSILVEASQISDLKFDIKPGNIQDPSELIFYGSLNSNTTVHLSLTWRLVAQNHITKIDVDVTTGMTVEQVRDKVFTEITNVANWPLNPQGGLSTITKYGTDRLHFKTSKYPYSFRSLACKIGDDFTKYVPQLLEGSYLDSAFLHPNPRIEKIKYRIGNESTSDFKTIFECFDAIEGYFNDPGGEVTLLLESKNYNYTWDTKNRFPRNVGKIIFSGQGAKPYMPIDTHPTLDFSSNRGIYFHGVHVEFTSLNLKSGHFDLDNTVMDVQYCVLENNFSFFLQQKSTLNIKWSTIKDSKTPFKLAEFGAELYVSDTTFDNLTGDSDKYRHKIGIVELSPHTKAFLSKNIVYTNGSTKTISYHHIDKNGISEIPTLYNTFNQLNFNDSLAYDEDYTGNNKIPGPHADNTAASAAGLTAGQQYYTATGDVKVVI